MRILTVFMCLLLASPAYGWGVRMVQVVAGGSPYSLAIDNITSVTADQAKAIGPTMTRGNTLTYTPGRAWTPYSVVIDIAALSGSATFNCVMSDNNLLSNNAITVTGSGGATGPGEFEVIFSSTEELSSGTQYWFLCDGPTSPSVTINQTDTSSYANGDRVYAPSLITGTANTSSGSDSLFKLYEVTP